MPLISCPECKKTISDLADYCPHCGLPSKYFGSAAEPAKEPQEQPKDIIPTDCENLPNLLLSFDRDYVTAFGRNHYISSREKAALLEAYAGCHRSEPHDIFKCVKCSDGYMIMIVKKNPKNGDVFYGCTNYSNKDSVCKNMLRIKRGGQDENL